jgi:diacylglycerol kinase family enzyme
MIEAGAARTIDTGFVVREGKAPEPFVLFVGAGADAEIVHRVHEKRAGGTLGKLRYIAPILSQLFSYKPVEHWFVLENGDRHGPFEQVIVTNVTSYGSMWKLPGRITPDDGLLDCIGFRAKTALQLLRHGVAGSFNRLRESNKLQTWQAARVRIESESTSRVQVDGDPLGEVRPLSLRLLVPGEPTT